MLDSDKHTGMRRISELLFILLSVMWECWLNNVKAFGKLVLLIPLLIYSLICLIAGIAFYLLTIIDIISYAIRGLGKWVVERIERIVYKLRGYWLHPYKYEFGAIKLLVYPIIAFALCFLVVLIYVIPKGLSHSMD